MTSIHKALLATAMTAAVAVVVYQAHEVATLRNQIRELKQVMAGQTQSAQNDLENARAQFAALQAETSRLNRNATEVLKLRADVTRLRNDAAEKARLTPAKTKADTVDSAPVNLEYPTNTVPYRTFSATNHVELGWGQTSLTGGWKLPSGGRAFVFITPQPGNVPSQLTLKARIVETGMGDAMVLGEAMVSQPKVGETQTDGGKGQSLSTMSGVLNPDQQDLILKLMTNGGLTTVREMAIILENGRQAEISSGASVENARSISLLPVITAGGRTVSLDITSALNYPSSPAAAAR